MSGGEWKGASWKQEEDFSKEAAEVLARVNATEVPVLLRSTTRNVESYIEEILEWEKKARFGGDAMSARKLAVEAVRIHRVLGKWDDMMELIDKLMRKRAQIKSVQSSLIAEASLALGNGPIYAETTAPPEGGDGEAKTEGPVVEESEYESLLFRLKQQCEGKIHLELEHARMTSRLAQLAVKAGNKREASDMLFGIQVETITNMPRIEKVQNVLMQLRLALELKDSARFILLSRKLNPRALGKDDTRGLKTQYFLILATHYEREAEAGNDGKWLSVARCWYEIFSTLNQDSASLNLIPTSGDAAPASSSSSSSSATAAASGGVDGEGGASKKKPTTGAPSAFVQFCNNNNQGDNIESAHLPSKSLTLTGSISNAAILALMGGHTTKKDLDDAHEYAAFSKPTAFATRIEFLKMIQKERTIQVEVEQVARLIAVFLSEELIQKESEPEIEKLSKFHSLLVDKPLRREALVARAAEHDLLVISRFYTCARIERLAELVGLKASRVEQYVMHLVDAGELFARFDRVAGVITFEQSGKPATLLSEWTGQVETAAGLVERAAQLISKERMVQATLASKAGSKSRAESVAAAVTSATAASSSS